jgi:uncharacterized membrane protein
LICKILSQNRTFHGILIGTLLMELFLILVLGAIVVWLVSKRSADQQYTRQLYDLASRLEDRVLRLERAQQLKAAASPPPEPQVRTQNVAQSTAPIPKAAQASADVPASFPQPIVRIQTQESALTAAPTTSEAAAVTPTGTKQATWTGSVPPTPPRVPPFVPNFGSVPEESSQATSSKKHSLSLEERLGANWLNKLGIVILVIGVTFFLAYQLRTLGPLGKTVVGYVISVTLLIGGLLLEQRKKYQIFARAGIGGGWALTFFVTYAMYHVTATHVLSSQAVDLILMMLVAVGMIWHSLLYKSQVVTSLAFLLAFCTVGISHVTVFSLVAGLLLALGLVYVTSRQRWYELELAGLVSVYLNHFVWLQRVLPEGGQPGHPFPEFFASAALLLLYWLIFRVAYVLRSPRNSREELLSSVTAILNAAGLLSLLKYQSSHPEWAFGGLLALGTAEMLFALYARRRFRAAFIVLSSIASVFLLAAVPFRFSGSSWSIFWLLEAEVLFLTGLRMKERVFRRLGLIAGFATAIQLAVADVYPIILLRQTQPDIHRHLAISIALICGAIVYWFNSQFAPRRWTEIGESEGDSSVLRFMSYLGLLAAMGALWVFFPGSVTVVAWMLLAVLLGLVAEKLASADLTLQADMLAASAFVRIVVINLFIPGHWGFWSQRAVTVALCAVLFYCCTRRKSGSDVLQAVYVPAAYSWAGSTLLGLLVWYELRPVSVAVGWGVLGLILFEIGIVRRRSYLRHQGYVLLGASFIRIFFANLSAGGDSRFLNPRMYTVLPLIAAYFWVYERLRTEAESPQLDRVIGDVAAWLGATAAVALAYFEFSPEWVVVVWSVLVVVLVLTAWLLDRRIFLAQALTLLVAVAARAVLFNLLSAPLVAGSFWSSRLICVGSACAVVLLALPIGFRLRKMSSDWTQPGDAAGWVSMVLSRPEQLLFFVPLLLLTTLLAVHMRAGMITVAWSALGIITFLFALLVQERTFRLAGLSLLLLGVGKILIIDMWNLAPTDRYITLIVMGAALLLVSFLYTRYREAILKLL